MFTEVDDQFFLQSLVSSYFEPLESLESLSEVIMLVFVYLIAIFLLLFERY